MERQYNVRISIDGKDIEGVYRNYGGTYEELMTKDWSATVCSFLDDIKGYLDDYEKDK